MSSVEERKIQKTILPGQTPDGEYILAVLTKQSYEINPGSRCVRAESDQKLIPGDIHYDDPMNSPVMLEADFVPFKIATDVVLNGRAYAPGGRPTESFIASLIIPGVAHKDVLLIGNRVCHYQRQKPPLFSDPEPFTTMDIRYDRAYGGVDIYSNPAIHYAYPRNHFGCGFVVCNNSKNVENLPLPNIEDPVDRLTPDRIAIDEPTEWEGQPMPQGFGWFLRTWQPRASFGGIMPADRPMAQEMKGFYASLLDQEQREDYEKAQLPDMDFRFFNGASPGLALPFLSGDEVICLKHLSPEGEVAFQLPGEQPNISLDIGMGVQEAPAVLQTVMIRMEDRQVDMVWRVAFPYPGPDWLPEMKKLEINIGYG